jgi:outer membrane immunogenic protein
MKKLYIAGAALIVAGSVHGADLGGRGPYRAPSLAIPAVPVFSWTGCYVGAQGGWSSGRTQIEHTEFRPLIDKAAAVHSSNDISGAVLGGQVGCDYQFAGAWVIGVRGAALGADINGVGVFPDSDEPNELENPPFAVKTDFLADVTGRIQRLENIPDLCERRCRMGS